jgi:hypothetical protein
MLFGGFAFACAGAGEAPVAVEDCSRVLPVREKVTGALAIGMMEAEGFREVKDGESLALIRGSQGGWMVVPTIRVDARGLGTNGACTELDIDSEVEALAPRLLHLEPSAASTQADHWYFSDLPVFLGVDLRELDGRACRLNVTFRDDGRETTGSTSGTLLMSP